MAIQSSRFPVTVLSEFLHSLRKVSPNKESTVCLGQLLILLMVILIVQSQEKSYPEQCFSSVLMEVTMQSTGTKFHSVAYYNKQIKHLLT